MAPSTTPNRPGKPDTNPMAAEDLPLFPTHLSSLTPDDIRNVARTYPIAFDGLVRSRIPQLNPILDAMDQNNAASNAEFWNEIKRLKRVVRKQAKKIETLKADQQQILEARRSGDLIANAVRDMTVQILEDQIEQLQADHRQLHAERDVLCADVDLVGKNCAYKLQEKDEEIRMLRGELSRLLTKNMLDSIEYNYLCDDLERLEEQLERKDARIRFLEQLPAEKPDDSEISDARSLRSKAKKAVRNPKEARLLEELADVRKETEDISALWDESLAKKDHAYRVLRNEHMTLKRKLEECTAIIPGTLAVSPTIDEPPAKGRKTRSSAVNPNISSAPALSKLKIDLRVFAMTANGTVKLHAHMHSLDQKIFSPVNLSDVQTRAWNILCSSYTGAATYQCLDVDDYNFIARTRTFPSGTWETIQAGEFGIWWIAANAVAEASKNGLSGEIDVMFSPKGVNGIEWMAERTIRMAHTMGMGCGFAVVG